MISTASSFCRNFSIIFLYETVGNIAVDYSKYSCCSSLQYMFANSISRKILISGTFIYYISCSSNVCSAFNLIEVDKKKLNMYDMLFG